MFYEYWAEGCRVTFRRWYGTDENGETPVFISFEYFLPGASLSRPPRWERNYVYSADKARFVKRHTEAFILNVVLTRSEKPYSEYRDGVKLEA